MSPRPHLLLFRLRAGFTSSLPQQSRTGLQSRQTRPFRARCLTGYAAQSSTPGNEATDSLRIVPEPVGSATRSTVPATPSDHVAMPAKLQPEADSGNKIAAVGGEFQHSTISSPYGPDPKVLHQQVGRIQYVYKLKNGKKRFIQRKISKETLAAERLIRSQKLFYDNRVAPRQWLAARDEISHAVVFGRKPQLHLVNLDLQEGDRPLLDRLKSGSEGGFIEAWQALSKSEKADHWYRLSLWLLYHAPSLVPEFLLATCKSFEDRPPMLMISKCITHLNKFSPKLVDSSLITACLDPESWPILQTPQGAARLYINTAGREGVYHAWKITRKKRTHVSPPTVLCYMKRFVEFGDVDSALEALQVVQNLRHPDFPINSEEVIRHCCKLLVLDTVADVGNGRNFCILPKLIELGIRPTRDMMNVVLSNALKGGDSQIGDVILDYMGNNQLEPDSYTYLALLTDAVAKGDRKRLGSLLQDIQSKEELHKNKWISSKILHSHFVLTAKRININDEPNEVFYSMLGMYNQLHDITALKDLSIVPPHYTPPPGSGTSEPSVVALYIMIATYLRCLKNIAVAERVYSRFRNHVIHDHPTIAPLAATDHTYNEFLVAFRDNSQGLRPAVRLVEDMQHAAGQKISDIGLKQNPPSVRTWTLLFSAFVYHRQSHAAERVLAMMDKHKVVYSMDTWNMLINHHANSQNHLALAETIKKMESEGFTMDEYSMRSLRYLRDPERLWVAVDELDMPSEPDSNSSFSEPEKGKEAASLLDQGLSRLKDNMTKN